MNYKLIGSYYLNTANAFYIKEDGGGTWLKVNFTGSGYYYGTGDNSSSDLLKKFKDTINTALASTNWTVTLGYATATLDFDLNTDNIVVVTASVQTNDIWLRFSHPTTPDDEDSSLPLANFFRLLNYPDTQINIDDPEVFLKVSTLAAGGLSGSRQHGYSLYPNIYLIDDLSEYEPRVEQSVPDYGSVETLRTAVLERKNIGIKLDQAYPRSAAYNDYNALVDFMDNASSGRPFRLYPDTSVTTEYAEVSNSFGYETLVLDKDSMKWKPTPSVNNWYKFMEVSLKAWRYIE